jgi:hypothetical protein
MTVLVRLGAVESRRFGFELVKPSSVVVTGGSASATVSALGSVEFTSCETLSLNGVFQSGYDNYMVVGRLSPASSVFITMRLRAGGADNSTGSSYVRQLLEANSTVVTAGRTTSNLSDFVWSRNTQRTGFAAYFYGPNLAQPTAFRVVSADDVSSASITDVAGTHNQSVSYDGFTLISSGAVSGRVAVYGMRG